MSGTRLSVFVLGATGEVGKEVVKELARHTQFEKVTLIGRRLMELPATDDDHDYAKFTQTIVNFDKLSSDHAYAFEGFDIGISTLGTTRGKSGKAGFYKVDHDYVVESAKLAKQGGCKHLNLVSSGGADKNSYMYYLKVKAEVEEEVTAIGFEKLTIYRPGVLLCNRTEIRAFDKVAGKLIGFFDHRRRMSVETSIVAKAIMHHCLYLNIMNIPLEVLENGAITAVVKEEQDKELQSQTK